MTDRSRTSERAHPDFTDVNTRIVTPSSDTLNDIAATFIPDDQPAISVDTKKKEWIGDYADSGNEWSSAGEPERVQVHDFADQALGEFAKAIPYGICDVANNEGCVSVGDVADTAEFAVEAVRSWWNQMGRTRFPDARRLLITADAGGSTATGSAPGKSTWPNSPPTPDSRSASVTTRPAPRIGTGSSTAGSPSSP